MKIATSSSQNKADGNLLVALYRDKRAVFNLADIALLMGEAASQYQSQQMHYYVTKGQILNPRRGLYAKPGYSLNELACKIYRPSYISFEYVLQRAGVIFQYGEALTLASYLSRDISLANGDIQYRRIKGEILYSPSGITVVDNTTMACPERAFLDLLYIRPDFYFDNTHPLKSETIESLLPLYRTKALEKKARAVLFRNAKKNLTTKEH
jgi:hypothetical protein